MQIENFDGEQKNFIVESYAENFTSEFYLETETFVLLNTRSELKSHMMI